MRLVCQLIHRWRSNCNYLVKRVSKLYRHVVVKPKSCNDGLLAPEFTIRTDARAGNRQAYNVLTAPVTARGNAVNNSLPSFSQVNQNGFIKAVQAQNHNLLGN